MIGFSRMKLFSFLLMLFVYVEGNAQPPIEWHVDRDSAFMHFPMRDSINLEIILLRYEQEQKTRLLYQEHRELFPLAPCIATKRDVLENRPDTLELQRLHEIKELELEANKILLAKIDELNTLMLSSFQSQLEAFCKLHPEKMIVFEPYGDSPDWFNLTTKFILFLEEKQ